MKTLVAALVIAGCANPEQQQPPREPRSPQRPASPPAGPVTPLAPDARVALDTVPAVAVPPAAEVWLKGTTHVHAKPSGDSVTPIPEVIAYYEQRGYDFIALTDHNRISEVGQASTAGSPAVRNPASGLIVLAGIELTYNPTGCIPAGDASGRCRIHVNLIGPTKRFEGKLEWANRKRDERVEKYQAAIDAGKQLGGVIQLNHPTWYWGMTADVMAEVARRGIPLVEIANVQFETWNAGDEDHPSTEALWDAVLARGHTMWGVASDDAHDYNAPGKYPAGGAWVVVRARRDPQAIVDALARGQFYASTGVTLTRAGVEGGELVVEVDGADHTIDFVENGKLAARVNGKLARRAVPATGYVRAVVTSSDGTKKAWVQPARR